MKAFLQRAVMATVMLLASVMARAYDFEVDGIYYNKTSDTEVEVTSGSYSGEVTIPSNVTYSGQNYSVTAIGMQAFSFSTGLTSINLSASITSIGQLAFSFCSNLTSIELPNSLTVIASYAFANCTNLNTIKIPASVESLGYGLFDDCSALISIDVDADNKDYTSIDGVLFNKEQTEILCCPGGKKGTYSIPNSVTTIGSGAFQGCSQLTTIEIPASVNIITGDAFDGCSMNDAINVNAENKVYCSINGVVFNKAQTSLIRYPGGKNGSYTVPATVTEIGEYAFSVCNGLTSIEMPNSVTSIGSGAFQSCENLTSLQIPESIVSIGEYAFYWSENIKEITVLKSEPPVISESCFYFNIYSSSTLYVHRKDIEAYKAADVWKKWETIKPIEDKTEGFADNGFFYNITSESEVEVTNESLGGAGFVGDITIPSTVTYSSKTYTVSSIGESAFANCNGITSVDIPASVKNIGKLAFSNCSALTTVKLAYAEEGPAKVIAENEEANAGTVIGESAFQGCSVLSNIYLGSTVASIGNTAFAACPEIESITVLATEPPVAQSDAFDSAIYSTSTLNVPVVAYDLYKTAPVWSNWATINSIGGSGIADSFVDTEIKIEATN